MAQQVLVYRLTGSAIALGIVNFMTVIPLIPFSFWGGSLADRVSKRNILLITQSLMLIQAVILAVLVWTDLVRVWHVYLMAFILGMIKAVDMPPRQSMVVEMVEGKEDLTSAIGLNSAIHNTARTLGPAIAGVVIAAMGEAVAFLINGLSFLAVLASLLFMRNLPNTQTIQAASITGHLSHPAGNPLCIQSADTVDSDESGCSHIFPFKTLPDLITCVCRPNVER